MILSKIIKHIEILTHNRLFRVLIYTDTHTNNSFFLSEILR